MLSILNVSQKIKVGDKEPLLQLKMSGSTHDIPTSCRVLLLW